MNDAGQFALVTFTSILFLVDPIVVIPAYLAFVRKESPARARLGESVTLPTPSCGAA